HSSSMDARYDFLGAERNESRLARGAGEDGTQVRGEAVRAHLRRQRGDDRSEERLAAGRRRSAPFRRRRWMVMRRVWLAGALLVLAGPLVIWTNFLRTHRLEVPASPTENDQPQLAAYWRFLAA